MQTSAIMLDSTLSKILTTKQVETKQTQIEPVNEQGTKTGEAQASDKPEAEVRLVFRFTVEEQVVYKGKVERVHQLESEELSRVVSRVAWDDANNSDKPECTEHVSCLDDQNTAETTDTPMDVDQHNQQNSLTVSDRDTSTPIEEQQQPQEDTADKSPDHVQENPNRNIESSDHEAYTRTGVNCEVALDCHHDHDESVVKSEESCAPPEPTTPDQCDINIERSSDLSKLVHETGSSTTPSIQDLDKQKDCDENQLSASSSNTTHEVDGSTKHCTDYPVESQTVTDTLNDCVNTVDIEISQEATTITKSPAHEIANFTLKVEVEEELMMPLISWPESRQNEICKINGLENNEIDSHSGRTSSDIISPASCNTSEPEKPHVNLSNGDLSTKPNNVLEARDTIEENNTCESDASSSNKRKSNGKNNNTSTKRIRRTATKEQRNLKTRTSSGTNVENTTTRRQSINTRCSNPSLLDNQQPRQRKIFAKWSDNHFYPGTILKLAKDRKYVVGFFDGAQRNVSETDLIPLCNIEGKQVRVSIAKNYCVNAIVHDQRSPVNDQPMFDVEYQQDGVVRKCVPLKDIFLTGEQGTPLISQADKNPGASNFADVDLDNIIYEKRSRRFQDMEDFELTDNSSLSLSL